MKKLFSLIIVCLPVLFFSCQKEFLSDQQVSTGTLTKDASGQCSKITVAGTYTAGTGIGDTNYIIAEVNVTSKGSYLISTDIINGYSFKASGNFSDTGTFRVKLPCTGKPITSGTNNFIIRYGISTCNFSINVLGVATVQPAVFTLAGAPDSCMNAIVSGNYLKNTILDTSNKVTIKLNVTSAGTYSIATNTVNGYNFSGSGLIGTGVQNVTLKASGKPLNIGTDVFSVTAASSCTFAVKVLSGVAVINTDHFPLTTNSYWTYDDLWNPGDTLKERSTILLSPMEVYLK